MNSIEAKIKALMLMSRLGAEHCRRGLQANDLLYVVTPSEQLSENQQLRFWTALFAKIELFSRTPLKDLPGFAPVDLDKRATWEFTEPNQETFSRLMFWAKKEAVARTPETGLAEDAPLKRKRVPTEKALASIFETQKKKKKSAPPAPVGPANPPSPPPPPPPSSSPPIAVAAVSKTRRSYASAVVDGPAPPSAASNSRRKYPAVPAAHAESSASASSETGPPSSPEAESAPSSQPPSSTVLELVDSSDTETDDGPSGRKRAKYTTSTASSDPAPPKRIRDLLFVPDEDFLAPDGGEDMVLAKLIRAIGKSSANPELWASFLPPRLLFAKEIREWLKRTGYVEPRQSCLAHRVLAAFQCRACDHIIIRQACLMTSNTKLITHFTSCALKNNHRLTETLGIKQALTPDYMQCILVEGFASNNRPFLMVNDLAMSRLIDVMPSPRPKLPTPKSLSRDAVLYHEYLRTFIVTSILQDMGEGVLHLSVDGWTSPNQRSFLGVCGSWWSIAGRMRTVTLDFIFSPASHSGEEMARQLVKSLTSLGLGHKLASITLDNASANDTFVDALSDHTDIFPRFEGAQSHVRCFAHTLNLITQGFLLPFTSEFNLTTLTKKAEALESDEIDLESYCEEPFEEYDPDATGYDLYYDDSAKGLAAAAEAEAVAAAAAAEEEEEESDEVAGRERAQGDLQTLQGMLAQPSGPADGAGRGNVLEVPDWSELLLEVEEGFGLMLENRKLIAKVTLIANRTKQSSKYRAAFAQAFVSAISNDKYDESASRANVPQPVSTRWNSVCNMLEVVFGYRDVIPYFYKHPALRNSDGLKSFPIAMRLKGDDFDIIGNILVCLKPIRSVTAMLQFNGEGVNGTANFVTIAQVIPIIDRLTRLFERVVNHKGNSLSITVGARLALGVLNKYYRKTGDCNLYACAILLHPSLRIQYMRDEGWPAEWQETAVEELKRIYDTHYKKSTRAVVARPSADHEDSWGLPVRSSQTSARRHPVDEWVYGQVSMVLVGDEECEVDAIQWWAVEITQSHALAGNGMRQFALDVLTASATSCAPERAFSKAGLTVSKHRHSLAPRTIAALQCVGAWVRQGWAGPETPDWQWEPADHSFETLINAARLYDSTPGMAEYLIGEFFRDVPIDHFKRHQKKRFQEDMRKLQRGRPVWPRYEHRSDRTAWNDFGQEKGYDTEGNWYKVDHERV